MCQQAKCFGWQTSEGSKLSSLSCLCASTRLFTSLKYSDISIGCPSELEFQDCMSVSMPSPPPPLFVTLTFCICTLPLNLFAPPPLLITLTCCICPVLSLSISLLQCQQSPPQNPTLSARLKTIVLSPTFVLSGTHCHCAFEMLHLLKGSSLL